ncbi:VWA domain-containing protein [Actinomadura spongiicola]|uniref:VWA domain-containing protein n=1 Tax=Actinomadura spongiicola TaxID=2303421 RepID=A0A372G8T7_9ACTN|nr:VIT domain-containing protein [Actinomadura spongiicola]RFS81539.1 VWA domain-containing protein [Actinomadura spongiicola]
MTVRILPLPDATSSEPDRGLGALSTDKGNLPLDSVDVHATITGLAAGVEIVQGFHNPHDVPLEATYIFPLPDRGAVTALRLEAADRVIEGTLKERAQARQDYDTAIASGQRAAIAEEDRPDVFTMRVGNILPGERVTLRLNLDQPLPHDSASSATFRFPLVVAPRFIPGAPLDGERTGSGVADDTDAVPDASRISPPVLLPGFPNPVALAITVDINPSGLPLTQLRSALHVVTEAETDETTTLRLQPGERLDRDFILRLDFAAQESASLTLVPDDSGEEGTFNLTVLPTGETRPSPRDVVLVLDRSGSMHGWKMVAARRAAARIVDTLHADDRFTVLSFDSVIERPRDLSPGLVNATDRNRFRAVEHLATLKARGGTEMLSPLDEACHLLADSTRDRVLVLITDGQVGNEDQLLAHLEPRLRGVRVHTVGIDRAVNAGFLNRLATIGQGRCELVESEDRLDEAMESIHHRISAPLATGLTLHPEDLEIIPDSVAPARLGSLFPGVPLVIAGRYRGTPSGSLTIKGTTSGQRTWEQQATATVTKAPATRSVWARAHLRDLEDRYTAGGPAALEQRIIDTSLRFGVLCRFTAFVAVDDRVVTNGGTPHQVVQPVETPQGWAAPAAAAPMAVPAAFSAAPAPLASAPPPAPGGPPPPYSAAPPPVMPGRASGHPRGRRTAKPKPSDTPHTPITGFQQELKNILDRLRQVPDSHDQRVHHLIVELLPLLNSIIQRMEAQHLNTKPLTDLRDDLRRLHPTSDQTTIDNLWTRTLHILTAQTGESTPRRPFWKRPK